MSEGPYRVEFAPLAGAWRVIGLNMSQFLDREDAAKTQLNYLNAAFAAGAASRDAEVERLMEAVKHYANFQVYVDGAYVDFGTKARTALAATKGGK